MKSSIRQPGFARLDNIRGLELSTPPLDSAIIPQALVRWNAAIGKKDFRAASLAPAIYIVANDDGSQSLVVADEKNAQARAKSAVARLTLCERNAVRPGAGEGQGATASLPRPCSAYALGHLLTMLKYPHPGSQITPHTELGHIRSELHFLPAVLVKRMGYSASGWRYNNTETALADLAKLMVRIEGRLPDGNWKTHTNEPLLHTFDSGRRRFINGVESTACRQERRLDYWRISPGRALLMMLNTQPADMTIISPSAWTAAGKSPTSQWLALYVSGHGYDASHEIFPHRTDTLLSKMRRTVDETLLREGLIQQSLNFDDLQQHKAASANVDDIRPGRVIARKASALRRQCGLRRDMWLIRRAAEHLHKRGGLAVAIVEAHQSPEDVRPSQIGQCPSRADLFKFQRWSSPVELAIAALPTWLRAKSRSSLEGLDAVIKTVKKQTGAVNLDFEPLDRICQSFKKASSLIASASNLLRMQLDRYAVLLHLKIGATLDYVSPRSESPLLLTRFNS